MTAEERNATGHEPGEESRLQRGFEKRLAGAERGVHAAVGVYLAMGFVAVALFALLARLVVASATRTADEAILGWVQTLHTTWLNAAALQITALGGGTVVAIVAITAGSLLWLARHRRAAVLLGVAVAGGYLLNYLLKELFYRPRPGIFAWLAGAEHHSFPSGHAMNATIAYGTLAFLVTRVLRSPELRRATWTFAIALVALVSTSRVYLGVHYPSDVLAGVAAGTAWVAVCALGAGALRYAAALRSGRTGDAATR